MNAAEQQPGCLTDDELRAFESGCVTDAATEERMAAHLGTCDDCDARLQSLAESGDPVVALLRAPDPFAPYQIDSHPVSFDSTKEFVRDDAARVEPPADSADLPEKIGKYFVLESIARGGFGKVFKAKDPDTQRIVAIKVPRLSSEASVEQFLKEARTAAQLQHRSIVQIYDWGRHDDGSCYVVMQYIDGRTLREALTSRVSHRRVKRWVIQIARALAYAHSRGIYHRDVKPENILLSRDDKRAYLADFGLAIGESERWEHQGRGAGTFSYMAPEQIGGDSKFIGPQTDLFSLGVVLYESLTGARPFSGRTPAELFEDIRERDPPPPSSLAPVPRDLEQVCQKCLQKEVRQRYPSAGHVVSRLRWKRHVYLGAAAGVVCLLVAIAIGVSAGHRNRATNSEENAIGRDRTLAAGEWHLLVRDEFRRDAWRDSAFSHAQVRDQSLFVRSKNDIALLSVGQLSSAAFQVRFVVRMEHWIGYCGFYWNLHEKRDSEIPDERRCYAVYVGRLAAADDFHVRIDEVHITRGLAGALEVTQRIRLGYGKVSKPSNSLITVQATVRARDRVRLKIDDEEVRIKGLPIEWPSRESRPFGFLALGEIVVIEEPRGLLEDGWILPIRD